MLMASMWQAPSVFSCTAGMFSAAIFSGVDLPGDVALDHADGKLLPQPADQCGDQAGLARAGAAHHIDQADLAVLQRLAHLGASRRRSIP